MEGFGEEMRRTMLRIAEQNDWAIPQSLHTLTTQVKKEELETVGDLSKVSSQIVLKCQYLARIGRPESLLSVNKLAPAVTKWKGMWQKLGSFDTYIQFRKTRVQSNKNAMWKIQHSIGDWDYFRILTLLGSWRFKIDFGRILCIFGSRTFRSHKSDVQETNSSLTLFHWIWSISLDAGLHIDGIPALHLWDPVLKILQCEYGETCAAMSELKSVPTPKRTNTPTCWMILVGQMLITSLQTQNFIASVPCFTFFKTLKQ